MKSIRNKSFILVTILLISFSSYALQSDTEQPINIDSDNQSLNLETNTVTFSDNVIITQGSILITANKVTIVRPNDGNKSNNGEKITATGNPIKFQQRLDDGKMIYGKANQLNYDVVSQFLTLTGNAQLKQQDSQINAHTITYDVQKQMMVAKKSGSGRVKTVLYPEQLQSK